MPILTHNGSPQPILALLGIVKYTIRSTSEIMCIPKDYEVEEVHRVQYTKIGDHENTAKTLCLGVKTKTSGTRLEALSEKRIHSWGLCKVLKSGFGITISQALVL